MPAPNNRICQVEGCGRKHWANNYCQKHDSQVRKHGHILTGDYLSEQGKRARALSSGSKGKHWSEEAKQRYSEMYGGVIKNTGRTHFKKGHKSWTTGLKDWMSPEHKAALIKANTGRPAWNKGKVGVMPVPHNKIGNGVTAQTKLERDKFRKTMVDLVFARDNYTCAFCDQYSGHLHVDHIKAWADYPELRFDLDNCRTLCRACHYYITFKRKLPENSRWGLTTMTRERG